MPALPLPLSGKRFHWQGDDSVASAYSASLLRDLGAEVATAAMGTGIDALTAWAESGLMYLSGDPAGPPHQGPAAIPSCARGALDALRVLAAQALPETLDGACMLSERAAILGLQRYGTVSPNQCCHLLQLRDGWLALNLARQDDWALLPAWLESAQGIEDWDGVRQVVANRSCCDLLHRGRLLGLPVAAALPATAAPQPWFTVHSRGQSGPAVSASARPLVVDLSALWAGPLCSHLLQLAGARVIKVESSQRLDGGRGAAAFFDLLNADKASVVLDLSAAQGRQQLSALLKQADIVIEGSRPRALRQLGIDADDLVRTSPGLIWLGISGYGRSEPQANWVAFGDDAAVAAGVAAAAGEPPLFCGDALADPLTGLHGALLALAFWRAGTAVLLDLSLCAIARHCLQFGPAIPRAELRADAGHWRLVEGGHSCRVRPPRPRMAGRSAALPGADTTRVLRELAIPC
jgi:hypothetical protein